MERVRAPSMLFKMFILFKIANPPDILNILNIMNSPTARMRCRAAG
jgi:hypothetical protein